MEREIMNAKECAEYLRVKPTWLYHNRDKEEIPYSKLGNKVIFRKTLVDDWLDKRTVTGKAK